MMYMKQQPTHIVEFDRLTQQRYRECASIVPTVMFNKWHTVARNDNYFAFVFEDRMDAERNTMRWSDY